MSQDEHASVIQEMFGVVKKTHHIVTHKPNWNDLIRPFETRPVAIPSSNLLSDANNFAPESGYIWDVTRISIQGFSAGSCSYFRRSAQDTELGTFSNAGTVWFQDHNLLVHSREQLLVFTATGLTGTALVSCEGFSVHQSILGEYLKG